MTILSSIPLHSSLLLFSVYMVSGEDHSTLYTLPCAKALENCWRSICLSNMRRNERKRSQNIKLWVSTSPRLSRAYRVHVNNRPTELLSTFNSRFESCSNESQGSAPLYGTIGVSLNIMTLSNASVKPRGGGVLPYMRYIGMVYRVWFLSRFGLKTGIDFKHFGLKLGMVIEETFTKAYKLLFLPSNRR